MGGEELERPAPTKPIQLPLGLCGLPVTRNRGALDWSTNGLACIGNGCDVVILDTTHLTPLVILPTEHKSSVNRVLWNPHARPILSEKPERQPRDLISTDTSNAIIFWDVERCQLISSFTHPDSKPLLSVRWSNGADSWQKTKLFLLYSSNLFVVLDVITSAYQNITVAENIRSGTEFSVFDFDCDPFCCNFSSSLAFLSENGLYFVSQWDPLKLKQDKIFINGKVTFNRLSSSASPTAHGSNDQTSQSKRQSSSSIRKLVSEMIVGGSDYPNQNSQNFARPDGTVQFHPNLKDHIVVSNSKEILLVNTYFKVIINTFSVERTCSSLVSVILSHKRPAIITLHENGAIFLRKYVIAGGHTFSINLETICCSDTPRLSSKKPEVLGAILDSTSENTVILHLCDGRFLRYDIVRASKADIQDQSKLKHFSTPMTPSVTAITSSMYQGKETQNWREDNVAEGDGKIPSEHAHVSLDELLKTILEPEADAVRLKMKKGTTSLGTLTCLQSRPGKDMIIAGTSNGFILVINIKDNGIQKRCVVTKRFLVHSSSAVCGIEFLSDNEVISYANLSFSANPKCEMTLTEITTGASRILKQDDPFHIAVLRISPLKQYFVLVYKNGSAPCELWDLPRRQLIKTLPTKLPPITCAVWKEATEGSKEETFYLTDLGTLLFTFRTERSRFSNATCVKLDTGNNAGGIPVSLIARGKLVYRADSSGTLVIYDTEKKAASPGVVLGRGPLLGIDGGTGDSAGLFVVHFNDQIELWNLTTAKKIMTLHKGKTFKALGICWMNGYLATIPRNSGGIRFLSVDEEVRVAIPGKIFSEYEYFLSAAVRCRRILNFRDHHMQSDRQAVVDLFEELCAFEEANFFSVVNSSLNQANGIDVRAKEKCFGIFSNNRFYTEVFIKLAQCVWLCDITKREEVAKALLWAGEVEKAAEILLDTEPSDPVQYIANGMKAALSVGSSSLPESTKAVLKIVATNLIASGEADEGLEMLCLLSKHAEAAKYVESANDWSKAILLSKTSLNSKQTMDSLSKYGQFLNSHRHVIKSASIYAYIGKFDRSIEVLFGGRQRHLCYILLLLCEQNSIALPGLSAHVKLAIRLEFARFIFDCGLTDEAIQFCDEIGEEGNDLKCELEILSSS